MLETMQNLALCYLWRELEGSKSPPDDLRAWFTNTKKNDSGKFFVYLVEPTGKIEKFYTLSADPDNSNIAVLESADIDSLDGNPAIRLPFNKPSGPRSPQIGPVIKRSYTAQRGSGPTLQILKSTLSSFEEISNSANPWADYFLQIHTIFNRKQISYAGEVFNCGENALHQAVQIIPETNPVFLVFKDQDNNLPGDIFEYQQYLSTKLDADNKYCIKEAPPVKMEHCSCCGVPNVNCYSAGLSKSGLNIFNIDRDGAFPNVTNANAFMSYAICENCADLLYVFKFHVIKKYITYIAGQETLMLPELYLDSVLLNNFLPRFQVYIKQINNVPKKALLIEKQKLIKLLSNEKAVCTLDIIWSKDSFQGQSIGKLSGQISDILPSKLRAIYTANKQYNEIESAFFPKHRVDTFEFDLNLSFLKELFWRPGGKKAKNINASRKLVELKRMIAEALYKQKNIPEKRFWEEIIVSARWYLQSLFEKDNPEIDCLYEGYSKKKNANWMSFAGWIKHLSMAIQYFIFMEVMEIMKNKRTYYPEMEQLEKYFSNDGGINTDEKAYAFVLGILYGRVMQIQGAKGVNVGSNALTWLKRLTLTGKDLPELYIKIREKLLAYEAEGNKTVRAIIKEFGTLGNKLGDEIGLKQTTCCYYILLGQSISVDLFPKNENKTDTINN